MPEVVIAHTATKLVVSFLDCGPAVPVLRFGSYHLALLVEFIAKREALVDVFMPFFHWVVVLSPLMSNLFLCQVFGDWFPIRLQQDPNEAVGNGDASTPESREKISSAAGLHSTRCHEGRLCLCQ